MNSRFRPLSEFALTCKPNRRKMQEPVPLPWYCARTGLIDYYHPQAGKHAANAGVGGSNHHAIQNPLFEFRVFVSYAVVLLRFRIRANTIRRFLRYVQSGALPGVQWRL